MTDNKLKYFEIYFMVKLLKADNREFRQDSDQLLPDNALKVCVLLPRENEYVYNLSEISQAELANDSKGIPDPILTPKGFAYVKQQLEVGFEVPKVVIPETEEWGNTVDTEKKLNPAKVASEWDEVQDWAEEKSDQNKPEVETWDVDGKENWE